MFACLLHFAARLYFELLFPDVICFLSATEKEEVMILSQSEVWKSTSGLFAAQWIITNYQKMTPGKTMRKVWFEVALRYEMTEMYNEKCEDALEDVLRLNVVHR